MFPHSDTHLRVLILERELALRAAARKHRIDGAFEREGRTVSARRSALVNSLTRSFADRLASAARLLRRPKPLASS